MPRNKDSLTFAQCLLYLIKLERDLKIGLLFFGRHPKLFWRLGFLRYVATAAWSLGRQRRATSETMAQSPTKPTIMPAKRLGQLSVRVLEANPTARASRACENTWPALKRHMTRLGIKKVRFVKRPGQASAIEPSCQSSMPLRRPP
jgi:hypothetical protein